jgi:hypothetical protein
MQERLLAEFSTSESLLVAVERLRELGIRTLDAYTPFPMRELEPKLGIRRSPIPWLVLGAGLTGGTFAYLLQYWCAAIAYPLNVGGRPLHSAPAFIPITFETTILFAALTAFVAPLAFARLPELHQSIFEIDGFERATVDRFWLVLDTSDPAFVAAASEDPTLSGELRKLGALRIVEMGGNS